MSGKNARKKLKNRVLSRIKAVFLILQISKNLVYLTIIFLGALVLNQYFNEIILVLIGIGTTALCLFLWNGIKWLSSIKKNVESMVENGKCRRGENKVQFQILQAHSRVNRTLLEVVARGENNGNVERAFSHLDASDKAYEEYVATLLPGESDDKTGL